MLRKPLSPTLHIPHKYYPMETIYYLCTKKTENHIRTTRAMKYLIIGGVAGGATAAARIRRNNEQAEIILIEKTPYVSYANCGLPYHIGEIIKQRDNLFLQTPEAFGKRFNIDVRVQEEALSIDPLNKTVEIKRIDGAIYSENYDKLLLSPGALPIVPPLAGVDSKGVFTLRNIADMDKIKAYISTNPISQAVIVGGGFIGLEMAENLQHLGISVTVVEMANQVMTPIDYSMASLVHAHLKEKGVGLRLQKALTQIEETEQGLNLHLQGGEILSADMVLLSIGVRPNTHLAKNAGIELGVTGGIKVNQQLQTSEEDIYAVGDVIEYPHPITKKPWLNYLAGPANRQARLVADIMCGLATQDYEGSIGTAIAKVFDLTVATTGLAAKALKLQEIPYSSVTIMPNSHAGYYPNASPITLKIVFDPKSGRLYGGQAVGADGVDKRIDQIAQLIKQEGTIDQLMQSEQAYAPPFSSAKDPIALAGYVAQNIMLGKMQALYWREMQAADPQQVQILDVRTPLEFATRHIQGAINIPLDELRQELGKLSKEKSVFVYCGVGLRGYLASNILKAHGFSDVRNLIGGFHLYASATTDYSNVESNKCACSSAESKHAEQCGATLNIDACGLSCPGPLMKLKSGIDRISVGQRLLVQASDPAFPTDAKAWCCSTGHKLIKHYSEGTKHCVLIQKEETSICEQTNTNINKAKGKTFILFSDDLDKALATFVLANGAAATGQKVSIFFTFWGLNAIKQSCNTSKKDFWGRMFSMMLPKDSQGLSLSKMNMGGLGAKMMRFIMKSKGVDSLESLRQQAIDNGVEFIACQMSMDVMGISRDELLPNVTLGGVATYMHRAEEANVNLFI